LKGEIAALEEQRAERKADLERLLGRQAELEQTLSEAKASRDGIGLEAASVKAEFNSLLRQVEAARASLRDAEDDTRRQTELAATLERELGARKGELAALQARIEQLQKTQYELDSHVAAAQGTRTKLVESNGRLEADRSALWVEFIGLQEKRNAAIAEASAAESRLWDLRQQRNALNNEVEMLKRLVGNMQQNASGGSARA
jgi:chromosome segregation ATPase